MALVGASYQILRSQDSSFDSEFPLGDKPPAAEELVWSVGNALEDAGMSLMQLGTPFQHDVRQYLSGTEAAAAVLSLVAISGDDPNTSGFTLEDDGLGDLLQFDGLAVGSGSFRIRATASQGSADTATKVWACTDGEPEPEEADFIIAATVSSVTFNGENMGVQPGHIIEIADGTHGPIVISKVVGDSSAPVLIRGPLTGLATIRRNNPGGSGFLLRFNDCRHFICDGESETEEPNAIDGKRRNIKIMYATNASFASKDAFTGAIKLSSSNGATYTATRDCVIRYVEVDGGWTDTDSTSLSDFPCIGFQSTTGSEVADYPGAWQESIILEHNLLRNLHGEGAYFGSGLYQYVRSGQSPHVPLRYIKFRYNWVQDCGGNGVDLKAIIGGVPGTTGATHNACHDNVFIRVGTDTSSHANGRSAMSGGSCKAAYFNNYVEGTGGAAIIAYAAEGVHVADPDGDYVYWIYNNVIRTSATIDGAGTNIINVYTDSITQTAINNDPSLENLRPLAKIFNNTVVDNTGHGITVGSTARAGSFIKNNISLGNSGNNVNMGIATGAATNLTSGTPSFVFVDAVGSIEAGTIDYHLNSEQTASGTIGTDISATDIEGVSRSGVSSKGAYEFA